MKSVHQAQGYDRKVDQQTADEYRDRDPGWKSGQVHDQRSRHGANGKGPKDECISCVNDGKKGRYCNDTAMSGEDDGGPSQPIPFLRFCPGHEAGPETLTVYFRESGLKRMRGGRGLHGG
ncbi:MAG: hypothetical protein RJA57_66 [Bacteroidota bacterium]